MSLLEGGSFSQWEQSQAQAAGAIATEAAAAGPGAAVGAGATATGAAAAGPGAEPEGTFVAMEFVTELLGAGRVRVKPTFIPQLLQHIVDAAARETAAAAAANGGSGSILEVSGQTAAAAAAAASAVAARQSQFVSVVEVMGINMAGQPYDREKLTAQQAATALQLATAAGFHQAAAAIHHLQGNFSAALHSYLRQRDTGSSSGDSSSNRSSEEPRSVDAAFEYCHKQLSGSLPAAVRPQFITAVRQQIVRLIAADANATAVLVTQHLPQQQVTLLQSLSSDPVLQFRFLNAMMNHQSEQQRLMRSEAAAAADGGAAAGAAAGGQQQQQQLHQHEALLNKPEVVDMYIRLLAEFRPSEVLVFLQGHEGYDVRAAIKHCQAAGELAVHLPLIMSPFLRFSL